MKHYFAIRLFLIGMVLAFASCGRQHQAEALVKDFMKENLSQPDGLHIKDYRKLDSTHVISDSIILAMRSKAGNNDCYRPDISYQDGPISKPLLFTRVTYRIDDQEFEDTYYLDNTLSRVVAFKHN